MTGPCSASSSARRSPSRVPIRACERRHITPVEERVAPQYANEFRQENERLIKQVKPAP